MHDGVATQLLQPVGTSVVHYIDPDIAAEPKNIIMYLPHDDHISSFPKPYDIEVFLDPSSSNYVMSLASAGGLLALFSTSKK